MSRKFLKYGWIAIGILLLVGLVIFPACSSTSTTPVSAYIGSGKLDGNGIPPNFFSDINVRKAMCYSFDYATFIKDGWDNQGVQTGSPSVPGLVDYVPSTPMYTYNTTLATYYWQQAWGGQVWSKGFKFTLVYNTGNLPRQTACTILANDLSSMNSKFQVSVVPLQWNTELAHILAMDMPMFDIGWQADYPAADDFLEAYMSTVGAYAGFQGYGNSTLDAQLIAAWEDTNPTTRAEKYTALQTLYYNDAPALVLGQPAVNRYLNPYVCNYTYNPMDPSNMGHLQYMFYNSTSLGGSIPCPYSGSTYAPFVEDTIGPMQSMDPAYAYDSASYEQIERIYDTLVAYNGSSATEFVPDLASSWSWAANGTTVTFNLRPGVQFQSGGYNVTAQDVKYSIERECMMNRGGGPQWLFWFPLTGKTDRDQFADNATALAALDSAIIVNGPLQISFNVQGSYWQTQFESILCGAQASIVCEPWAIAQGAWNGTLADVSRIANPGSASDTALFDKANGTGAWYLPTGSAGWNKGVSVTLEANPHWWGGAVPFSKVVTNMISEWSTRKVDLATGAAAGVYVPATNYPDMTAYPWLKSWTGLPTLVIEAFQMNFDIHS